MKNIIFDLVQHHHLLKPHKVPNVALRIILDTFDTRGELCNADAVDRCGGERGGCVVVFVEVLQLDPNDCQLTRVIFMWSGG